MFGMDVKIESDFGRIAKAEAKAEARILRHRAEVITNTARESIDVSDEPSRPGSPPHTRGKSGHNLRDAIQFDVTNGEASHAIVGEVGAAMEFGGSFRGDDFDERPFMLPALLSNLDGFADDWRDAITE